MFSFFSSEQSNSLSTGTRAWWARLLCSASTLTLKGVFAAAQGTPYPGQPLQGPGGADYVHESVAFYDCAEEADGYWLFEPRDPIPDSAHVVVFLHGYGAYNPMTYGKWIKHLVAKGNIVIYPRYQYNVLWPRPDTFPANAAKAIQDALYELQNNPGHVRPVTDQVCYIGHSYGGVIASNLGVNWAQYGIPRPASMLLAQPGSGPFSGARLEDYSGLPADMKLAIIVGEGDYVVGDEFARLVMETAIHTSERNLIVHRKDVHGSKRILATHNEPYALDLDFDTGVRNYTARRVLMTSRLNEADFYCYWKIADALMLATRESQCEEYALGGTPEQRFMGVFADGRPIRPLDVYLPEYFTAPVGADSLPNRERKTKSATR